MKIIIAGSRSFDDYEILKREVIHIFHEIKKNYPNISRKDITVISGNARGADKLGLRFAEEFHIETRIFEPDWKNNGLFAGFLRNEEMINFLDKNDILIAFWNGISHGTWHIIKLAEKRKISSYIIEI